MRHLIFLFIIIFILSLCPVIAETKYVSDTLIITMRSGPSTSDKIVDTLKNGTPVTLLETDENARYSKVRLRNNTEGWVLHRYLIDSPTSKDQLKKALETIKILKTGTSELHTEHLALKQQYEKLELEANKLAENKQSLSAKLGCIKKAIILGVLNIKSCG